MCGCKNSESPIHSVVASDTSTIIECILLEVIPKEVILGTKTENIRVNLIGFPAEERRGSFLII